MKASTAQATDGFASDATGANAQHYLYTPAARADEDARASIAIPASAPQSAQQRAMAILVSDGIQSLIPGWRLNTPLQLSVEREMDYYLVSDDIFNMYGTGDTFPAALHDYFVALSEHYAMLERDAANHEPNAAEMLARLARYIVRQ